jgi:broad-specificity NMP kinase
LAKGSSDNTGRMMIDIEKRIDEHEESLSLVHQKVRENLDAQVATMLEQLRERVGSYLESSVNDSRIANVIGDLREKMESQKRRVETAKD